MQNITIIFKKNMKMSELIDADYRLLLLLNRLNIHLGFGEKSVDAVCQENNFDTDCFLFLANYQSKSITDIEEKFKKLPLRPFLQYLKSSHSYFLDKRLPNIRRKLELVFKDVDERLLDIVLNFFDSYKKEVSEHMKYEDDVVFPYVHSLVNDEGGVDYSINMFEERHNDIEGKMNDLKQILMKYVPGTIDQMLMVNVLTELYMSEEELAAHTFIEDHLVIPRVKEIEQEKLTARN